MSLDIGFRFEIVAAWVVCSSGGAKADMRARVCLFESLDEEERIVPIHTHQSLDSCFCRRRTERDKHHITRNVAEESVIGSGVFVVENDFVHSRLLLPCTFTPHQGVNNQISARCGQFDQVLSDFTG